MNKNAPRLVALLFVVALACANTGCLSFTAGFYYGRGMVRFNRGTYDQAIADFSVAISLKYKLSDAYAMRSLCYYKKDDYTRALADADQAVLLGKTNATAYQARALAYYRLGDMALAREDLQQVITLAKSEHLRDSAVKLLNAIDRRAPNAPGMPGSAPPVVTPTP